MEKVTRGPGHLVVRHVASGKVFVAVANNLQRRLQLTRSKLRTQDFSNETMQQLYNADPNIEIEAVNHPTQEEAQLRCDQLIAQYSEQGLLVNGRHYAFIRNQVRASSPS